MLDEPEPPDLRHPSWLPPIAIGALATAAGTMLLLGLVFSGIPSASTPAQCCCSIAFVPFGALPAWLAFRRDRRLTPGQGFAVAFIAVGLGSVLWAGSMVLTHGMPEFDAAGLRKTLEEQEQKKPENERVPQEQVDRVIAFMQQVWSFVPAVVALLLTVFGGLSGLITASILRSRAPPATSPPEA